MNIAVVWDVAFVRTDVSEERIASVIRVTRISELGTFSSNYELKFAHSFHPDDGGDTFLRNVGS
jgi:hypothetical protein